MWLEKRLFSVDSDEIWFYECGCAGVYRLFADDFILACELFAYLAVDSSLCILNYYMGTFSSMPFINPLAFTKSPIVLTINGSVSIYFARGLSYWF